MVGGQERFKLLVVAGCMMLVTGCVDQSYKMIGRECSQVVKYEPPYSLTKNYIHSVTLYEGYRTRAHFDVMIMSNQIRIVLAELHSVKAGHTPQKRLAHLKEQLAINREYIELYVLSQVNDPAHISLSDKNSSWSIYLTTAGGVRILPIGSKEVSLTPEMAALFGHRYVGFKGITRLTFPAHDLSGKLFVKPGDKTTITFGAAGMSSTIAWTEGSLAYTEALQLKKQNDQSLWQMIKQLAQPKERDEDYYFC